MRHIGSLVGGLIAAPIIWVLLALGQGKAGDTVAGWVETGLYDTADLVEPAIYLVVAALIVGLLATLRISPVGPIVVGLAYLVLYVLLFMNPVRLIDWLPANRAIAGRDLELPVPLANGTLLIIGVALLISVFSFGRWRSRAVAVPVVSGAVAGDAFSVAERDAHETRLEAARERGAVLTDGRTADDLTTDERPADERSTGDQTPAERTADERAVDADEQVVPAARTDADEPGTVTEVDADGRPVRRVVDAE